MNNSNINQEIVTKLLSLGLTISTCESITAGLVSNNLVQIENASKTFIGGLVTYATETKIKLAKVNKEIIDEFGVVSIQCAKAMAEGCQKVFNSDIAISTTGNASKVNLLENQPSGMAFIGIRIFDKTYGFKFISKYNSRVDIINECVAFALFNLWELIKDLKK